MSHLGSFEKMKFYNFVIYCHSLWRFFIDIFRMNENLGKPPCKLLILKTKKQTVL